MLHEQPGIGGLCVAVGCAALGSWQRAQYVLSVLSVCAGAHSTGSHGACRLQVVSTDRHELPCAGRSIHKLACRQVQLCAACGCDKLGGVTPSMV